MTRLIRHAVAMVTVALIAGAASGQYQGQEKSSKHQHKKRAEAKHSWKQVINQMEGEGISLEEAISEATDKVGGNAISARIVTEFTHPRGAQRYEGRKTSEYRVEVLCRTDQGKFKVVTINGRTGRVLGTAHASANRFDRYDRYTRGTRGDWKIGEDDFAVFRLIKCSALEDTTVRNKADEELGHIADFAVDPSNGLVSYAALSFGGWLEMGDDLFAVPLNSLEIMSTDDVVLDLTKRELERADGFNQDNWPRHADRRWANKLRSERDEGAELVGHEERERRSRKQRERIDYIKQASDLIGMDVRNRQDEELGTISDLYIDPDRERVAYAVLSHGGWLGIGDKLFAIPWESFKMDSDRDKLVLNMSRERLKNAPGARESQEDTWNDPDWVITVYEFFEVDPYWETEEQERYQRDM